MDKPPSAAEQAKIAGNYLRGTLSEELANGESVFSKSAVGVLKFHGVYQQDDRDLRKLGEKQYSAMVRVGVPGGVLTPEQYLTLDRLADIGDGSLRITTRQDIQYHYVPKARLQELIRGLNESYLGTLAACGDVVRNVVSCPAPFVNEQRQELQPTVLYISRSLKPKTTAYYDIWVNGEKVASSEGVGESEVEPLYGPTYLPRKFKIGFAFPGDNTTDVYANDIGVIPQYADGRLTGFTILAGGGMGQSAGVKASHPRLASPICSIGPDREELLEVCKAMVTIHRDFGNRSNRKLARLKYVLDDWGVERFKQELDSRVGRELAPPRTLSWHRSNDYLGWHRQTVDADGRPVWFVGVRVVSGRVRNFDASNRIRSGIRAAVEKYRLGVRLTSQQNLYLAGVRDADRADVAAVLSAHGIAAPEALPPVLRHAISCPALPTCGQAITESERAMPGIVAELQDELNRAGLPNEVVHLRTSGCPNGCSRPYTAEVGIVGASVNMYTIYLGASSLGTRLGQVFAQNVKREAIIGTIRPVIDLYRESRQPAESFGDFCNRIGMETLKEAGLAAAV
jgi:sulfite reductase (ferredoxin)